MKYLLTLFVMLLVSCVQDNNVQVTTGQKNKSTTNSSSISVTNINVANNLFTISGLNLDKVTSISVNDGTTTKALAIDSKSATNLIAKATANFTIVAGRVFTFVISDASAAATFTVDFSLCSSTLGTKSFDCSVVPNDKEVLSYDAASGKWKPRAVNGLSYLGAWNASGGTAPSAKPAGSYYIVATAGSMSSVTLEVGDWIVSTGSAWQKVGNSTAITTVFGRTGAVVATEGDYNLDKLSDVTITTPTNGQILKYNGTAWVNQNFSLSLPTCSAGQVLKSDGTTLSCVTDNTGAGSFTGTASRLVVTDGSGLLTNNAVTATEAGYLAGVTSSIQTQLNSKLSSYTETDPSVLTFAKTVLPSCAAGEVLKSDGVSFSCVTDNAGTAFSGTANKALVTNGSGALAVSSVTDTEISYVSGVTSAIQTQLNAKQGTISKTTTQDVSKLRIYGANATNYVELSAATLTGNRSFIFPDSNGSSGEVLSTDGSGNLSWIAIPSAPVTTVAGRTGAITLTTSDVSEGSRLYFTDTRAISAPITNPTLTNSAIATNDTIQVALGKLQAQFNNILSIALTGLDTTTNAVITATDTVLGAFGKLQKQITDLNSTKLNKTGGTLTVGTISGVPTPTNSDDVANKGYVDSLVAASSSSISYTAITANTTATAGAAYLVDTSGGSFTVTLPTTPAANTTIRFIDAKGTFGTNNLIIAPNAANSIMNQTAGVTLTVDINRASFDLVYTGSTYGWQLY